jgi:hypothetical protein
VPFARSSELPCFFTKAEPANRLDEKPILEGTKCVAALLLLPRLTRPWYVPGKPAPAEPSMKRAPGASKGTIGDVRSLELGSPTSRTFGKFRGGHGPPRFFCGQGLGVGDRSEIQQCVAACIG